MTIAEFIVTYAVCWWLVLFMLLPQQAQAAENPEKGHAPSAPENPRLGKKMRWTTVLAFIPAIGMYFVVAAAHAHAEEGIYHAGGDSACAPLTAYQPSADVNAKDGMGAGGRAVKPATLDSQNFLGDKTEYDIPLNIPSANYNKSGNTTADLSESFIGVGKLSVSTSGETKLNGKSIAGDVYPPGCAPKTADEHSTKE
jgi:predicted secreted protein